MLALSYLKFLLDSLNFAGLNFTQTIAFKITTELYVRTAAIEY